MLNFTIVQIYKKGGLGLPENFRPISLQSIMGKLRAKHLECQLTEWTQSHIISPEQIGFSKNKSAIDQHITGTLAFLHDKHFNTGKKKNSMQPSLT